MSCDATLHFGHPQAVEVAVGVNGHGFVVFEAEFCVWRVAWIQGFAHAAVFCLDEDPFDVVGVEHWMVDAADVHAEGVAVDADGGQMLFAGAF